MSTVEELQEAMESVLGTGTGQVAIGVYRAGLDPVSAFVNPVVWGALWDVLALDPQTQEAGLGQPENVDAIDGVMQTFGAHVLSELVRARQRFPQLHSLHEGLAVLLEEYREVEALVFSREPDRARLYAELVQVAAMARRFAEDMDLGVNSLTGGRDD